VADGQQIILFKKIKKTYTQMYRVQSPASPLNSRFTHQKKGGVQVLTTLENGFGFQPLF
jgi:hypothetical protein